MNSQLNDYMYFESNFAEITKGHVGEHVAIKDKSVLGYYKNIGQAVSDLEKKGVLLGTFILQECFKDINDGIIRYYSRYRVPN